MTDLPEGYSEIDYSVCPQCHEDDKVVTKYEERPDRTIDTVGLCERCRIAWRLPPIRFVEHHMAET